MSADWVSPGALCARDPTAGERKPKRVRGDVFQGALHGCTLPHHLCVPLSLWSQGGLRPGDSGHTVFSVPWQVIWRWSVQGTWSLCHLGHLCHLGWSCREHCTMLGAAVVGQIGLLRVRAGLIEVAGWRRFPGPAPFCDIKVEEEHRLWCLPAL